MILLLWIPFPAFAEELTAPEPPSDTSELMPYEDMSFGEGLWHIVTNAFGLIYPNLRSCIIICFGVIGIAVIVSILQEFSGKTGKTIELAGTVAAACMLFSPTHTLIREAADTVRSLSEYGKLLLPVMTAALAAQGGGGTATALYVGTALFDSVLASMISNLLIPMVYMLLAISVSKAAIRTAPLEGLQKLLSDGTAKGLRIALYIITGYLTVSGVVGGAADQISVKAAKLTISGMVPVVGSIMADASETILVSASVVKNAIGVYGLWSVVAIGIGPFLNVGVQYLTLKITQSLCLLFSGKAVSELVGNFASAMGLLLAMTGTMSLLMLISTICFMKGMG